MNCAVHDEVLNVAVHHREERSTSAHLGQTNGERVTITIEVAANGIVVIEDVLTWICGVRDVRCHLHVVREAVGNTVQAFSIVNVCNRSQEEALVLVELCGITAIKVVEVEATASGADMTTVEVVLRCQVAAAVGIGDGFFCQAVAIGCCGSIDPTGAECCGNGEGVCADALYPSDGALVVVQLIANTAVCKVGFRHDCCSRVGAAPVDSNIVVVASATIPVGLRIIGCGVNSLNVAIVSCNVSACA